DAGDLLGAGRGDGFADALPPRTATAGALAGARRRLPAPRRRAGGAALRRTALRRGGRPRPRLARRLAAPRPAAPRILGRPLPRLRPIRLRSRLAADAVGQ